MSTKADNLAAKYGANLSGIVGLRATGQQPPPTPPKADKYEGAIRSRAFGEILLDLVDRDPTQPREEFDEMELNLLGESIRKNGQLTPIRVRRDEVAGRWVVLVGERRYRACKIAGLKTVRVEFVEGEMSPADVLEEQIVENMARAAFKPAEEGKAYRRLMELKAWTVKELIDGLKVEPTSVHRALGLARLPDDVAAMVDRGEIKPTAGYELSKIADASEVRTLAQAVVENNLGHKAVVEAVAKRKDAAAESRAKPGGKGRGPAKPQRPTFEVLRAGGAKITVEFKKAVDARAVLAALEEATERQREKVEAIEGEARDVA